MGVEDGGNNQGDDKQERLFRQSMAERWLDKDVYNAWAREGLIFSATNEEQPQNLRPELSDKNWDRLEPKQHYSERTARNGKYARIIMELSNPEAVAAYDKLVDEYNDDLERIKKEKDVNAVRNFYLRASSLIYNKK